MTPWLAAVAGAVAAAALQSATDRALPQFIDVTRDAGIAFHHTNGASAEKHLVETMGSGGLFFDYDGDGWTDLFLVDGGSLADAGVARQARHRLATPFPISTSPTTGPTCSTGTEATARSPM
jgi:hypothetical protein